MGRLTKQRFTIRVARQSEMQIIARLDREIFALDEPVSLAPPSCWWLAFEPRGRPVAFAGVEEVDDWTCFVRCGVLPSYQGRGLQKRLIRVRLAYAKRARSRGAITYVMPYNAPSANSLISQGFRVYEPSIGAYTGDDVLYLKREFT